jgi:hypothetical protein
MQRINLENHKFSKKHLLNPTESLEFPLQSHPNICPSSKAHRHRNKYMEEKFHREKKTIELIETLVECIEN